MSKRNTPSFDIKADLKALDLQTLENLL